MYAGARVGVGAAAPSLQVERASLASSGIASCQGQRARRSRSGSARGHAQAAACRCIRRGESDLAARRGARATAKVQSTADARTAARRERHVATGAGRAGAALNLDAPGGLAAARAGLKDHAAGCASLGRP